MDRADLPRISTILSRLDVPPGRRGRTRCPIHQGDNSQAFSYDDSKGQWFCFRCGIGGDAIELVKRALEADFRGALQWLGIEPGKPTQNCRLVGPSIQQQFAERIELQRTLREEYRLRGIIELHGLRRLRSDPDSRIGWELLAAAYSRPGMDAISYQLDRLLKEIPREAYRRRAA